MYWRLGEPDDVLIKAWKLDNKQIMYLYSDSTQGSPGQYSDGTQVSPGQYFV